MTSQTECAINFSTGFGTPPNQITELSSSGAWNRGEVYAGGRHLATYSGGTSGTTYFIHADWLGTERARSTATGSSYETCTSLPFGDALTCSGSDPSPIHFTGKERDAESGLDNFGARYNASTIGRFMSPDPLGGSRRDPQTLNKYAFSRNNPLRFIDPTGLYVVDANCAKDKKCAAEAERFEKARQQDLKSKDSAVRSAAEAYGDPGKANGVSVNFADKKTVAATCGSGAAGCTAGGFTADANGNVSPDVKVLLQSGLGDTELQRNTAHEGSHVQDDLNFINSFDLKSLSFDSALNFTRYDTEFKAYAIGNAVGTDPYAVGTCGSSPCVFRPGARPEETYRTIDQMLTDPKSSYRAKGLDVLIYDPSMTKPR